MDGPVNSLVDRRRFIVLPALGAGLVIAALAVAGPTRLLHAVTDLMQSDDPSSGIPTEAEARAKLAEAYQAAQAKDVQMFCANSSAIGICENQWRQAGGDDGVPSQPPTVVDVRVQDQFRVLTICGLDGQSHPYRSDFPVRKVDGELTVALDVFWYSKTFSGSQPDGQPLVVSPGTGASSTACPS